MGTDTPENVMYTLFIESPTSCIQLQQKKNGRDFEVLRISKLLLCMQVLPPVSQIYKTDLLFAVWTADSCMPEILSNVNFIFKKVNKVEIELPSNTDTQKGYLCCQILKSISFMQVQCTFNWKINDSSCFYLFQYTLQTFSIQRHKNVHPVFYHFHKIN